AALAAGRDRDRTDAVAEFHDGDEAVAAGAVDLLGALVRTRAEGRQRSPPRRREADRNARTRVVEGLHDVTGETLEAIDLAPRRFPAAKVRGELVRRFGQRLESLFDDRAPAERFAPEHSERGGDGVL